MVRVLIAISFCFSSTSFANETAVPLTDPQLQIIRNPAASTPNNGDLVGEGNSNADSDDIGDRTMGFIGPIASILIAAGMKVAGHIAKQVAKNLTEQTAQKAAQNFARQILEKKGNCFSVKASKGDRVLLAADRQTVLFAGDHDSYMRAIAQLCQ